MFVDLNVGILANCAGVHQNHVCTFSLVGKHKAILFHERANEFRVILVHLTAEGFQMYVGWYEIRLHRTGTLRMGWHSTANWPKAHRSDVPIIRTSFRRLARSMLEGTPTFRKFGVIPMLYPSNSPDSKRTDTVDPIYRSAKARCLRRDSSASIFARCRATAIGT